MKQTNNNLEKIEGIKDKLSSFTCHKTVKASKMSKLEYAKLMGNPEPYEDEPGYVVVYEDGYVSWSPAKAFDDGYKLSEAFTDRLKNEMEDLEEKCQKLEDFLSSSKSNSLDELQKNLLGVQLSTMVAYYGTVRTRYELLTQSKEQ